MSASNTGLRPPFVRWFLLACGAGAFAACSLPQPQPDLTRFYVLTPTVAPAGEATAAESEPRVFIRPVAVPEFLRGKIMLLRLGNNEVRYVDEARWAEPLEAGLVRVLREDLARRTSVRLASRVGDEHEFDVLVQLRQCEGIVPAHVARLAARIEIYSAGLDPKLVAQDDFSTDIPGWDGRDFAQLAGKLSDATAALAERIATLVPRKNT